MVVRDIFFFRKNTVLRSCLKALVWNGSIDSLLLHNIFFQFSRSAPRLTMPPSCFAMTIARPMIGCVILQWALIGCVIRQVAQKIEHAPTSILTRVNDARQPTMQHFDAGVK